MLLFLTHWPTKIHIKISQWERGFCEALPAICFLLHVGTHSSFLQNTTKHLFKDYCKTTCHIGSDRRLGFSDCQLPILKGTPTTGRTFTFFQEYMVQGTWQFPWK